MKRSLAAEFKAAQAAAGVATVAPPTTEDRIAELCIRHHLGQYAGTTVGRRLERLFAAPLDRLEETTTALVRACDFLDITGRDLERLAAELDTEAPA